MRRADALRIISLAADTAAEAAAIAPPEGLTVRQFVAREVRAALRADPLISASTVDLEAIQAEFHETLRLHLRAKERLDRAYELAEETPPPTP